LTKLLILVLLAMAWTGMTRLVQSILNWSWLIELEITPGPLYLAIYGALQGILALVSAAGIWSGKSWAYTFSRAAVILLFLMYWLERILFTRSPTGWTNLPFSITASLVLLAFAMVVLSRKS
jgi:uncharacterized membrane protein